jgi:mevalonate kinase
MGNKMVTYSAPFYAIISGSEGIKFGKPALGMAINSRVEVTLTVHNQKTIEHDEMNVRIENTVKKYIRSLGNDKDIGPISFSVKGAQIALSDMLIPKTAACVAGLLELYSGEQALPQTVNSLTHEIVKKSKKNVSGIESSAVCFGGLIYFRKEFEFLKGIYQLPFNIPKKIERNLYVSILPSSQLHVHFKPSHLVIYNQLEKMTKRIILSLIKEDDIFFQNSFQEYQALRSKLFDLKDLPDKTVISQTQYEKQNLLLLYDHNFKKGRENIACALSKKGVMKMG